MYSTLTPVGILDPVVGFYWYFLSERILIALSSSVFKFIDDFSHFNALYEILCSCTFVRTHTRMQ